MLASSVYPATSKGGGGGLALERLLPVVSIPVVPWVRRRESKHIEGKQKKEEWSGD